jgi:hypothetical protein
MHQTFDAFVDLREIYERIPKYLGITPIDRSPGDLEAFCELPRQAELFPYYVLTELLSFRILADSHENSRSRPCLPRKSY